MESVTLSIDGMKCGGCATKVSTALSAIAGASVEEVAVGSARVSFDPEKTTAAALISALDHLGFKACSM
jgi:copper chaperone